MKQVIFIGGSAYSGSTLLDMTLANDPHGFSCGEVRYCFYPTQPHHINAPCGCGDPGCTVWSAVKRQGADKLYQTIFAHFPEVEYIVDSSKDPFWIRSQSEQLRRQGVEVKHLVIWKEPLEIASSYQKRGEFAVWERSWVNYHRVYYSLIADWRSLRYRDFAQQRTALQEVCHYLEIPYFAGKERYWDKQHHLLFGNSSALVHLRDGDRTDAGRQPAVKQGVSSGASAEPAHRTVYYNAVHDDHLRLQVEQQMAANSLIGRIVDLLAGHDVATRQPLTSTWSDVQLSLPSTQFRAFKRMIQIWIGRWRIPLSSMYPV